MLARGGAEANHVYPCQCKTQLFNAKFCSVMAGGAVTATLAALAAAGDVAGAAEDALMPACKQTSLL